MFHVGIDLGRLDTGVSEHFLHQPQIGASGEQVGSKAVSQAVGTDVGLDPGSGGVTLDQSPQLNAIERSAAAGQEQVLRGLMRRLDRQLIPNVTTITLDRFDRAVTDRNDALFAAFAFATQLSLVERKISHSQGADFRGPAAGGVEHFQHCHVALPKAVRFAGCRQERFHLAVSQDTWYSLPHLLGGDQFGGVLGNDSFELQELEEGSQRDHVAGDRSGRESAVRQFADVVGKLVEGHAVEPLFAQPADEPFHVAVVGGDGVGRQMALAPQIIEKIVADRIVRATRPFGCSVLAKLLEFGGASHVEAQ